MSYASEIDVVREDILLCLNKFLSFKVRSDSLHYYVTLYALDNPIAYGMGGDELDATKDLLGKISNYSEPPPF